MSNTYQNIVQNAAKTSFLNNYFATANALNIISIPHESNRQTGLDRNSEPKSA